MGKRYFVSRRKQGPGLVRVVVTLSLVLAGAYGLAYFYYQMDGQPKEPALSPGTTNTLEEARNLLKAGNPADAEKLIAPLLEEGDKVLAPQAMLLQAEICLASNREDEALTLLQQVYEEYTASATRQQQRQNMRACSSSADGPKKPRASLSS